MRCCAAPRPDASADVSRECAIGSPTRPPHGFSTSRSMWRGRRERKTFSTRPWHQGVVAIRVGRGRAADPARRDAVQRRSSRPARPFRPVAAVKVCPGSRITRGTEGCHPRLAPNRVGRRLDTYPQRRKDAERARVAQPSAALKYRSARRRERARSLWRVGSRWEREGGAGRGSAHGARGRRSAERADSHGRRTPAKRRVARAPTGGGPSIDGAGPVPRSPNRVRISGTSTVPKDID